MIHLTLSSGKAITLDGDAEACGEVVALLRTLGLTGTAPSSTANSGDAWEVFDYWRERTGHKKALFTMDRKRVLETRLHEERRSGNGLPVAGLKRAVDGALLDPWYNGADGQVLLDFENIFVHRGRGRIEHFQRFADDAEAKMQEAMRLRHLLKR